MRPSTACANCGCGRNITRALAPTWGTSDAHSARRSCRPLRFWFKCREARWILRMPEAGAQSRRSSLAEPVSVTLALAVLALSGELVGPMLSARTAARDRPARPHGSSDRRDASADLRLDAQLPPVPEAAPGPTSRRQIQSTKSTRSRPTPTPQSPASGRRPLGESARPGGRRAAGAAREQDDPAVSRADEIAVLSTLRMASGRHRAYIMVQHAQRSGGHRPCATCTPWFGSAISSSRWTSTADKLGLKEVRRTESQQGRFTLVFLGADENPDAQVELTYNWDPGGLHRRAQFRPSRLLGRRHLRHLPAPDGQGRDHQSAAARWPHGFRQIARRHLDRAAAAGRGAAAARALDLDAEHRQLVSFGPPRYRSGTFAPDR